MISRECPTTDDDTQGLLLVFVWVIAVVAVFTPDVVTVAEAAMTVGLFPVFVTVRVLLPLPMSLSD